MFPYINRENGSYFYEEDNNIVLECKVPGLSKDDMNVTLSEYYIIIEGENKNGFYSNEVYKKYNIPKNIDKTQIDASVKNGIIKITFPKMENKQKLKIKIN